MRRGGSAGRHRGRCTPVASGAVPGGSVQEKCEPGTPVSTQDSDTSSAGGTPGGERVHQASPGYGGVPEVPGARTYVPAPAPISSQFPPARLPPVPPLPPRPELPARSAVPGSAGCQAPRLPAGVRGSEAPGCAAPGSTGLRAQPLRASAAPAPRLAPPGSAPPGGARSARRRPTRRGGRGAGGRAGWRWRLCGSGPPRSRLEAPYLGSDVRGSRRGRTTHFFPFTPQSFLSPGPGSPRPHAPGASPLARPQPSRVAAGHARVAALGNHEGPGRGGRQPGRVRVWGIPTLAGELGGSARRPPPGRALSLWAPPRPSRPPWLPRCHFLPGPRGGLSGKPRWPPPGPCLWGTRLGRTLPGGHPSSFSKCALLALLWGGSSAPGSPHLPRREFALMSTGAGWPGQGLPRLQPGGGVGGGWVEGNLGLP